MEIAIYALIWFVLGYAGFLWLWLQHFDLTTKDAIAGVFFAFLGPIACVMLWLSLGEHSVLIRRRK